MSSRNRTRSAGGVACNARHSNAPCFGETSSALSKNWSCAKAVESLSRSGLGRAFVASRTNPTPGARGSSSLVTPSLGVLPSHEPTILKAVRAGRDALPRNDAWSAPRMCSASANDNTTYEAPPPGPLSVMRVFEKHRQITRETTRPCHSSRGRSRKPTDVGNVPGRPRPASSDQFLRK